MHLPDINFWLAIAFQSQANHLSAKAWMQSAARRSCCFCRVTQMGFLRLSTNRKVFPLDALSMVDAWRAYDEMLSDERVVFAEEPDDLEVAWRFDEMLTHHSSLTTQATPGHGTANRQLTTCELFLNFAVWVVKYRCNSLFQSLNTRLSDVHSAAAARTPKNQRKEGQKSLAQFPPVAKMEPTHGKSANWFDRFLKLNENAPRQFKENPFIRPNREGRNLFPRLRFGLV
jgi:predicted nucleic acid-binding protein